MNLRRFRARLEKLEANSKKKEMKFLCIAKYINEVYPLTPEQIEENEQSEELLKKIKRGEFEEDILIVFYDETISDERPLDYYD